MRDPEIRAALVARLRKAHPDPVNNRIWPEMTVGLGASRVDVGLVNGRLSGYEIKSERDNLRRLPSQVEHYGRCLDRAAIVVGARHLDAVAEAVPEWWGLLVARPTKSCVRLTEARRGRDNPGLEPFFVAQMLWRDEAFDELRVRGLHAGLARATRWQLWERLADLPLSELRGVVRARLKARPEGGADDEPARCGATSRWLAT